MLFRSLNDAANGDGEKPGSDLGLRFNVDSKKKSPPAERTCWFTGPDPAVRQAEQLSEEATADVERRPYVPSLGIPTSGSALESGKRVVAFFISYAHENKSLADVLVKELRTQFDSSRLYELKLWTDDAILVGERWRERIEGAIAECDFGLLLVSPAFLSSPFIREYELPRFVGGSESTTKPIVPVGLEEVDFDRHDLKGLGEHQFFRLPGKGTEPRFYAELPSSQKKKKFAHELFLAIADRLDAYFKQPRSSALAVPKLARPPSNGTTHRAGWARRNRTPIVFAMKTCRCPSCINTFSRRGGAASI